MTIENEMIHGCLPRSRGSLPRQHSRSVRSARRRGGPSRPLPLPENPGLSEWDAGARDYKEMVERCEQAGKTYRPPWRTRIEDDTLLIPRAVAGAVCEETSLWLGEPFPGEWVTELAERANVVYQHNARFRRLLRKRGNAGRDWLWAFMRHWLCALLDGRRPDLSQRLPRSYAVGRDLPPPPTNFSSGPVNSSSPDFH